MEIKDGYKIVAEININGEIQKRTQLYSCFKYLIEHTQREIDKDAIREELELALKEVA